MFQTAISALYFHMFIYSKMQEGYLCAEAVGLLISLKLIAVFKTRNYSAHNYICYVW